MKEILFYRTSDPYGCFSNFSRHGFMLEDIFWPTAEHYFQASKFIDIKLKLEVANLLSPMDAALYGRDNKKPLRPDWEEIKNDIMRTALYHKFNQNKDIEKVLLSTIGFNLIEHTKNDSYWGDGGNGTGKNMLGRLLMEIRDNIHY